MTATNHAENARRMREALIGEARRLNDDGMIGAAETVGRVARDAEDDTLASLFEIIRAL
jgi:hypothetical protein